MFDKNGIRILSTLNVIQYREVESTGSLDQRLGAGNVAQVLCTDEEKNRCTFNYINGESERTVWPGRFL